MSYCDGEKNISLLNHTGFQDNSEMELQENEIKILIQYLHILILRDKLDTKILCHHQLIYF